MKHIFLILIFFCFFSTSNNAQTKIKFTIEKEIKSTYVKVPSLIYSQASGIIISGQHLILIEPYADKIFSVFKLPDLNYIESFGVKGRGPMEFLSIQSNSGTAYANGIKIFDDYKGLLFIRLDKFATKKTITFENQIKIPGEVFPLNDPIQISDSIILGLPYIGVSNKPFVKFNTKSKKVTYFGDFPKIYAKEYNKINWEIYNRQSVLKPDGTKFVIFCSQVKMFQIYSTNQKLLKDVLIESQKNLFEGEWIRIDPIKYYTSISVTDKYIYALCQNEHSSRLLNNKPVLEVWDWQGNPIASFKLDIPVSAFSVTSDGKYLYCIDWSSRDKFFIYKMDDYLR